MGRALFLAVALSASACPRREPAHESAPAPTPRADAAPVAPASAPRTPGPLSVRLEAHVSAQGVGLSIQALGEQTLALAEGVAFDALDAPTAPRTALNLRLDCKTRGCVKLAPGAELLAPPWLGQPEAERCDALFVPPAAGTYRLIVRSCDAAQSAELRVSWPAP